MGYQHNTPVVVTGWLIIAAVGTLTSPVDDSVAGITYASGGAQIYASGIPPEETGLPRPIPEMTESEGANTALPVGNDDIKVAAGRVLSLMNEDLKACKQQVPLTDSPRLFDQFGSRREPNTNFIASVGIRPGRPAHRTQRLSKSRRRRYRIHSQPRD